MFLSLLPLFAGMSILLAGNALLGTLLGVRAAAENFSDAATGAIMSLYFLGFILGTFACPPIIRRVGHIRSFTAMAGLASVASYLHVLLVSPYAWGLLRLVTGVCQVGLYIVVESWLNERAPRTQRGGLFASYVTLTMVAMALGQFLLLVDPASGPMAFGLSAVLYSLGLVPVAMTRLTEPTPVTAPRLSTRRLYEVAPLGALGSFTAGLANSAFWGLGAVFAQRVGLTGPDTAAFLSATILGGAVLQWPIGRLSDHRDRRSVLITVCFCATGVATTAFFLLQVSMFSLIVCGFVYGGLVFSVYGLSVAHLNDHLQPGEILEATRGILLLFGAGAAIGPLLAGIVMNVLGPASLLGYFALAYGVLALFALHRRRVADPVPEEKKGTFIPMARISPAALRMYPSPTADTNVPAQKHGRGAP